MSDREQLTYLRNNDLRAEIVRAVGGDPAPYETAETSYCLRKADLVRVAETLTSYDEPSELTLRELYDMLDAAVPGMAHSHNAGNTWGIARGSLKALHRDVHDESQLVTDGGSDVCSDGTDQLTVTLNGAEHTVPNTVETEADILRAVDLDPAEYRLYRDADVEALGPDQLVGKPGQTHLTNPVVVSEGDEFVAVPRGCFDA